MDQLLDQDGLADACAAEQTDLAALQIRADQIDDLDSGLQDLAGGLLILIGRRRTVDRPVIVGLDRFLVVDRFAEQVQDSSQIPLADRHADRSAGVLRRRSPCQPVC